jgi:FKBP-type peptidyl-prolyl cis-trans isomerase
MKHLFVFLALLLAFGCAEPVNVITPEEQLQIDLEAIDKYLADNNITAVKNSSGLRYVITQAGTGPKPNFTNIITVKYSGRLLTTGEVFDQAINPVSFPLTSLIQGWQIAFPLLNKGSKATLYVPSGLGYGTRGSGASIPPNANLIFDVELIDFR